MSEPTSTDTEIPAEHMEPLRTLSQPELDVLNHEPGDVMQRRLLLTISDLQRIVLSYVVPDRPTPTNRVWRIMAAMDRSGVQGFNFVMVAEYPADEKEAVVNHFDTLVRDLGMGRPSPRPVYYTLEFVEVVKRTRFFDVTSIGMDPGEDPRDGMIEKARCHSCNDPAKPITGSRLFEGEGDKPFPVCAECAEGIDTYGESG